MNPYAAILLAVLILLGFIGFVILVFTLVDKLHK